ncbi:MAG: hypothetical protein M3356_02050 [Actinomycetota bacterium]|nr:hypothetical protein [Actinomycetota bacterium]
MAPGDPAPEHLIRRWLDEHGPATVGMGALEQSWELERLDDADRREIATALEQAGVVVDPPLETADRADRLSLSVAEAAVDVASAGEAAPRPEFALAMRLLPIALGLMVFGSLGPWAKDIFVTDYGIERGGYVILAIAVAAGLLLALHARGGKRSPLPLLAALLATAALVVLAADFRELVDDDLVSPAWGLYAAFAGAAALVGLSMSLLTRRG